jgi:hypothetical protein
VCRERLVDAVHELQGGLGVGAEELLELTEELIQLFGKFVITVLMVAIFVMNMVVVVVVCHRPKLADLAQGGGQFPPPRAG